MTTGSIPFKLLAISKHCNGGRHLSHMSISFPNERTYKDYTNRGHILLCKMSCINTMKKVSGVDNTITGFVLGVILIYEKWG
jgi:hypothetical protein